MIERQDNLDSGASVFDLSLGELFLVAVLALVLIPPEDLPKMFRLAGRYYGKVRRASDELRRAFNAEVAKVEAEERREEMKKRREELEKRKEAIKLKEQQAREEQSAQQSKAMREASESALQQAEPPPEPLPEPIIIPPDPRLPDDAAPRILPPEV
jgi:sec-independent protein translocase protein TatB